MKSHHLITVILALGLAGALGAHPKEPNVDNFTLMELREKRAVREHDADITKKIRTNLGAHSELSPKAQSVSITTTDGVVTLAGPVVSVAEESTIREIAAGVVGSSNVVDDMNVLSAE